MLKTQLTAYLFSSGPYPTAYSLWSCVVTCVLLLPFFFVPCCFPQQFPQQWGYPTLKNKYMSEQPPADATPWPLLRVQNRSRDAPFYL